MKNNQGTASDIPAANLASDAEAIDFKLDTHLIRLMFNEPFYSHIFRSVKFIKTESIPTAGVLVKDGEIRMWWNPRFLASLTDDEIQGLLIHECWHI